MKRGMKVLFAVGAVLALASSPGWSVCPFSFPIFDGGNSGQLPATYITDVTGIAQGSFFAQGQGQTAVGAGNDSGSIIAAPFEQRPEGWAFVSDWGNAGVDGCPNGASTAGGAVDAATVAFVTDDGGNYVVIGVTHGTAPVPSADFDLIPTNQAMEPQALTPAINILSIGVDSVVADVLPAAASVNCYDDGSGICNDPNTILVDVTGLTAGAAGAAVPGCDAAGCAGVTLARGQDYCWDGSATVAGQVIPGAGFCSIAPLACTTDAECAAFTLGTCIISPPTIESFGSVPTGCVLIADNTVADQALNTVVERSQGHKVFSWDVNEFNVSEMQVVGVGRRGERVLNDTPIFARANDGSLQSYQALIPNGTIKGDKEFTIRVIGNDGTVKDTPVAQ